MSFSVFFSVFTSCGHFIQRSDTILAILVEDHQRIFLFFFVFVFVFFFLSGHWPRRRCPLKKLLTDGLKDGRTTYDRQISITIATLSTSCSGELKINLNSKSTKCLWAFSTGRFILIITKKETPRRIRPISSSKKVWNRHV